MSDIYRLWALKPTEENETVAYSHEFYRITPFYILIYTKAEVLNAIEINGENLPRLSLADRNWIISCAAAILDKNIAEATDSLNNLNHMVDAFGNALEEEREKLKGEQ